MVRSKPVIRALAVVAVASLALAACGKSSNKSGGASSTLPKGDGVLTIGTLLPQTGSLAFLGPPEFAGVDLAIKDINDAGGVNGKPVVKYDSDSGDTTTDTATQSVNRLLTQKVDAIIGAASSSVSLSVIDKIKNAGVVEMSPANTSPALSTYNDLGYYFRTAPSDVLQGRVDGNLINSDGVTKLAMLVRQDSYGTGLADNVEKAYTAGGGQVAVKDVYDPNTSDFSADVAKVKAASPDGIIFISFDEFKKLAPKVIEAGLGPDKVKWYLVDGDLANYDKDFPAGTLKGAKGSLPGAASSADFKQRVLGVNPQLNDFSYTPESYDAAILIALAAEAAKNDTGAGIKSQLQAVSAGGTKCTSFKDCKALIDSGKDIDYDGVSGPIEFDANGDPSEATIGIYQYGADNKYTNLQYLSGKLSG